MAVLDDVARTRGPARGRSSRLLGVVRLVLLAVWLVVIAGVVVVAEQPASYADLEQDLRAGEVDRVLVRGDATVDGRGYAKAELLWRDGPLGVHRAEVLLGNPRGRAERQVQRGSFPAVTRVTGRDVPELLSALDPDVRVDTVPYRSGAFVRLAPGWELRGWLAGTALVAFLGTVMLLTGGPRPRRATAWAWFWLLLSPLSPLVAVALLTFGYPTPFLPTGHEGRRGLTGGWAFWVMLILGGLATTTA